MCHNLLLMKRRDSEDWKFEAKISWSGRTMKTEDVETCASRLLWRYCYNVNFAV